jgi:hypothetical protein
MIGRKKLSTIREEIERALATSGDDPIRWLEQRMAAPARKDDDGGEVLQSLQRFLAGPQQKSRRTARTRSRK